MSFTLFPIIISLLFLAPLKKPTYLSIYEKQSQNHTGKQLATRYCQMCHKFPEPNLLDKKTWKESVLPDMRMRMGIRFKDEKPFNGMDSTTAATAKKLNIYPDEPLLSKEDWDKIAKYYIQNAPNKLPLQEKESKNGTFPFNSQFISIGNNMLPQVTLLKFNQKTSELYVGDYLDLYALKSTGKLSNSWKLNSPAVHIDFKENTAPMLLTIGSVAPSDKKSGTLSYLKSTENSLSSNTILSHLYRPVHFTTGDLNMDNKTDLLVSNFGNYGGKLSWFDNFDPSKEHILRNLPGATKAEIKDFNNDNKPDIIALMAQAYEQIAIYYNKDNGEFEEKPILQFPPVHGANYFELADFNNDGFDDLLVTNGDNRDTSTIEKPYHGVRIYLNDGKNNFEQAYFYPMYECSKAMARDFDNDGDLDIVAASFYNGYSDLKNTKESVTYLSNTGDLNFIPSYLPEAVHGKWLTMEVGDFNNDNLLDVMLGTCIFNFSEMGNVMASTGISSYPQILLLTHK